MQVLVLLLTLGRFSNDGRDDKENAKKATSFKSKTTNYFTRAVSCTFSLVYNKNANSFQ